MDRTTDSIRNKVFSLKKEGRHDWLQEERIGFLDLEASNLKANIGNLISWAIKPLGKKTKFDCWTREEAINWDKMDRRIMTTLIEELQNYDLIVTYYGTGFDNKFMRTRAMILDLPGFPQFGTLKHFDLYYAVRGKMSLYSNRLAVATAALGIEGKTPLPASIWGPARLGYPKALKEIKVHNVEDVKILEDLYHLMLPHVQVTRKSI
jgi:uncharacterized protein YprB with RNaseH-like and TPR domain